MAKVTPLEGYPKVRKGLYQAYWLIGVVLGAIPVVTGAIPETSVPSWSLAAMAVYGYLGIAFGFTADKNTEDDQTDEDEDFVEE